MANSNGWYPSSIIVSSPRKYTSPPLICKFISIMAENASLTLPMKHIAFSQELIQNADDAGARTIKFFLDSRQHGTSSLVKPEIGRFQGPALLAYNDAQFTDDDWEGIQNLQRSGKAEDPFKVGKFGIGFNSVYHITGKHNQIFIVDVFELQPIIISILCQGHS